MKQWRPIIATAVTRAPMPAMVGMLVFMKLMCPVVSLTVADKAQNVSVFWCILWFFEAILLDVLFSLLEFVSLPFPQFSLVCQCYRLLTSFLCYSASFVVLPTSRQLWSLGFSHAQLIFLSSFQTTHPLQHHIRIVMHLKSLWSRYRMEKRRHLKFCEDKCSPTAQDLLNPFVFGEEKKLI